MLDHDDYMPFGLYEGYEMCEIPNSFLIALYNHNKGKNIKREELIEVLEYIEKYMIKKE
jgi:uncharacterized protein (DUF3820 family)